MDIVKANGNQLLGCTFQQDPFVYLQRAQRQPRHMRPRNAKLQRHAPSRPTSWALAATNGSVVANGGDGLLDSGTSTNTQVGGPIPLGNVISGNDKNGVEVSA